MTEDYVEETAIGVHLEERQDVEGEQDPEIPSVIKDTQDVELEGVPEGDIDELMKEEFVTNVEDVQEVVTTTAEEEIEELEKAPEDQPNYTDLVALAEHDPSVVDPDEVALESLKKQAQREDLHTEGMTATGGEAVMDAFERATEAFETEGISKEKVVREAVAHAMEMASNKQEAAQLAGDYVLKAVDDTKLSVKARSEAVNGFGKSRQYVGSEDEAPNDVNVKQGDNGSLYYETKERGRGNSEATGPTQNDLLDMGRDELGKAMDVDPNDPDESFQDIYAEGEEGN